MSDKDQARYATAMHAMQSGVKAEMKLDSSDNQPKHLRVGVNSAMISDKALTVLLIQKGIFTEDEFFAALAQAAEDEVAEYETRLSVRLGYPVKLA